MTEDEKRLAVGVRGGGKTEATMAAFRREIGVDPAVPEESFPLPDRIAGWLGSWGYVLGPRTNDQQGKCWRWDFCYNSGAVDWLLWKCPWLSPLFERYEVSRWEIVRCRRQGHPCGWIYYNPGALEPDTHCKYCNEDIG